MSKNWPEVINKSIYCWETDYDLKRLCQIILDDLNSIPIYLVDES